jgi:UDP-N-acetylglucosamine 2-epimerase
VTAQHRQMLDGLLEFFDIRPDYDLDIMKDNQSLEYVTKTVLEKVGEVIRDEKPSYLLVQGDTTTGMAASLAAFYQRVKVAHVEAGLRTYDKLNPYPEEVNRRIIDSVSDVCFAHTESAKRNLLKEGIDENIVTVTGNTVIDALLDTANKKLEVSSSPLKDIPFDRRIILVTAHRRENLGDPLVNICQALRQIADEYKNDVQIVYPVHLNPNVQKTVQSMLGDAVNISLLSPLDYHSFVYLMKKSHLILTDSGGLQEEAPSLGKPVLVLREVTERPEAIEAGVVEIVGTDARNIVGKTKKLLDDKETYNRMAKAVNPYGDGKASQRIVERLVGITSFVVRS